MSPLSVVLLGCIIAGVVGDDPPGLKARITPMGLEFASKRARSEILKMAKYHSVPDQHGDYGMWIGTVHYRAYRLYISEISIISASIQPEKGGVWVSLNKARIAVHGSWEDEFNWLPFGDTGSLDVILNRVYLRLFINIGYDGMGKPTVRLSTSSCAFRVVYISLSLKGKGKYNWIYRKMKESLEEMIRKKLYAQVCPQLVREVNIKAAEILKNIKVVRPITKYAEIDLGLTSQPEFGSSVTTYHKGTVYETAHHQEPPFNVSVLPGDPDESNMAVFWITDYAINSACYVLHNTGSFMYILTKDNIPAGVNLNLNTSGFEMKFLIPELSKLYPKRLMQIYMHTSGPPKVKFGVSNVSVAMEGYISVSVVEPNRSLTSVFTLGATANISARLGSYMTNVTWDKVSISFDVKLLKSAISDLKIERLRQKLKLALKMFIMPKIKQMGNAGIPIPSLPLQGYALSNLNISHGQNFLKIGTDMYHIDWLSDIFLKGRSQPIPTFSKLFY
ncbi:Bactericidal permeability-increasing protein [Holothuria leucospilota]|uniref:Bactericidal permeability-increasing protein n=1 Tax=Holothuria leucospilota TaxID=206669 RepID=A0A9Q1CAF3_HOLLE|nr:Bactericidal permeability-increasing protein [Holothuria leucospilota]